MKPEIETNLEIGTKMHVNKLFTLVFLKKNNSVLLGLKTRGLGKGLWNGFGGKVEKNESVLDCARRELKEESNLVGKDLKQIGVVRYDLLHDNSSDVVHIFTCTDFEGSEKPSEEMNPIRWYKFRAIPFTQMWPDSVQWYPCMLDDKYFSARVIYTDENTIKESTIQVYNDLSNALEIAK